MQVEERVIEALLEQGNAVEVKPKGYSMYPMLVPDRDKVILERTEIKSLKRGDVILYRRDSGHLVLHRIWKRNEEGFYLVGDNQTWIEGPLRDNQIKGKLTAFERKGQRISVRHPVYVAVSRIWLMLRPLRPAVSGGVHLIKRCIFRTGK